MKKTILPFLLIFWMLIPNSISALQYAETGKIQIDEIKNAYKAIVKITTYALEGNILHTGTGVFINEDGTCLAPYSLFKNATHAEITDFRGNKLTVKRILGANSNYDLVKFSTEGGKKVEALTVSDASTVTTGTPVHLMHYTTKKKEIMPTVHILKVEEYDNYKYFRVSVDNTKENFGRPLVSSTGQLIAFVQKNEAKDDSLACAIDTRFANDLTITATSAINADLRAINIPKALPSKEKDALTYIYMLGTRDSVSALTALNDFIDTYPENAEGYTNRANYYASHGEYTKCEQDYLTALTKAPNTQSTLKADEVHNEFSKQIYKRATATTEHPVEGWTFERACEEAEKAHSLVPNPYYLLQQGRCYFALKEYQKAYQKFVELASSDNTTDSLSWSQVARAEAWFYAARSLEMAGGDSLKVIALMDSTISKFPIPYTQDAAPYLLYRAQLLEQAGEYRRAVTDYNEYEKAIGPKNLNAKFYYLREQIELRARMFQQALDDIRTAINYAPEEPIFRIEEALVLLRAGLFEETVSTCQNLLKTYPNAANIHKILGIAYGELGKKSQAITELNKAKELGDSNAETFLQKYK